jgi:hypothetical protein
VSEHIAPAAPAINSDITGPCKEIADHLAHAEASAAEFPMMAKLADDLRAKLDSCQKSAEISQSPGAPEPAVASREPAVAIPEGGPCRKIADALDRQQTMLELMPEDTEGYEGGQKLADMLRTKLDECLSAPPPPAAPKPVEARVRVPQASTPQEDPFSILMLRARLEAALHHFNREEWQDALDEAAVFVRNMRDVRDNWTGNLGRPRSKSPEYLAWLEGEVRGAGGSLPGQEVKRRCEAAGIPYRTLHWAVANTPACPIRHGHDGRRPRQYRYSVR